MRPRMSTEKWRNNNEAEFARQVDALTQPITKEQISQEVKPAFEYLMSRKARGENIDRELQDYRIHIATNAPQNTREGRMEEARKEAELARRKLERMRAGQESGQSAEEFYSELAEMSLEDQQFEQEQREELGIQQPQQESREEKWNKIYEGMGKNVTGIGNDGGSAWFKLLGQYN